MLNWDDYGKEEKAKTAVVEKAVEPKPTVPQTQKLAEEEVQPVPEISRIVIQ